MALPSNVGKGTVTGRFIDSAGANIVGSITFAPTPKRLLNTTAEPSPVTILPKPVTVALSEGSFTQALIATDDTDNNPHGWTYSVTFNFTDAKADGFSIEVPQGQTVNLTTVAPVGTGNGTMILRGPGVPDWTDAADGQVVVLVDGEPAWGDGGSGGVSSWNDLTDKPTTFTPATHSHAVANVTGLQAALDGKQAAGSYAAASHSHAVANVTGLQSALDGKADATATTSSLSTLTSAVNAKPTMILRNANGTWPALPSPAPANIIWADLTALAASDPPAFREDKDVLLDPGTA